MKVTFYRLVQGNGNKPIQEPLGTLVLSSGVVKTEEGALKGVLDRPLYVKGHAGEIDAKEQPELFMENLHRYYRSPYFWASKVHN